MRAVRVVRHAAPLEALELQDIPVPEPGPGEVRIAVSAASLNFGDIARCRGTVASVMGQLPFTLGMDVCGVVEAAGEGAEEWLGQRVVATHRTSRSAAWPSFALATVTGVFDAPPELDDVEAAAFMLPVPHRLPRAAPARQLQPGETLLVVGGASAVGTAVIQLGVAAGAHVHRDRRRAGEGRSCAGSSAPSPIDHHDRGPVRPRDGAHRRRGADVCVDMIGGDGTETIWTCMAREGRYVPVGFNDDPESGLTGRPLRKVSMGNFSVVGVMMGYNDMPVEMRRFGLNTFPPAVGREVHAALLRARRRGHDPPGHRARDPHGRGRARARRPRPAPHERPHRRRRRQAR